MNKKIKKIIATISAVAMCVTSVVSIGAGAIAIFPDKGNEITQDTVSFYCEGLKYTFWQAGTDFFGTTTWNDIETGRPRSKTTKVYISEPYQYTDIFTGEEKTGQSTLHLFVYDNEYFSNTIHDGVISPKGYSCFSSKKGDVNYDKIPLIEEYLKEHSIEYTITNSDDLNTTHIKFNSDNMTVDEIAELATDIRKSVDWSLNTLVYPLSAGVIEVTNVENALPEPTLLGDANEDGEVNLADAVLIMQALSNPSEYELTPQGMANADIIGDDGITPMDALTIQEMGINK